MATTPRSAAGVWIAVVVVVGATLLASGPAAVAAPGTAPNLKPDPDPDAWLKVVTEKADQGAWLVVHGPNVGGGGDRAPAAETLGARSHVALLDKPRGEVIETAGGDVRATPLPALLASATRLQIVRPPEWTLAAGEAAVLRARARVGRRVEAGARANKEGGAETTDAEARWTSTELVVGAYDGRQRGWKLAPITLPADLASAGTLVFDSGARDTGSVLEARFARRLTDARGVPYAAEVAPGIYRGGQPDADGIAWLKSKGIKTIVNLRHFHGDTEKIRVESAGITYHRIALASSDPPATTQVARFLALVRDPTLRPIYFHCKHGVDRTGAMMAVYRIEEEGWTNAEAFAEMQYFFAHRMWRDLRKFVKQYQRAATSERTRGR